jgi:hypothetical protein
MMVEAREVVRSEALTADTVQILQVLQLIVGEGNLAEMRVLGVTTMNDPKPHVANLYSDQLELVAAQAAAVEGAKGVYIVLNQIDPRLRRHQTDALRHDIARRR